MGRWRPWTRTRLIASQELPCLGQEHSSSPANPLGLPKLEWLYPSAQLPVGFGQPFRYVKLLCKSDLVYRAEVSMVLQPSDSPRPYSVEAESGRDRE